MRILITGANGFVGRHLERELVSRNHEVFLGVKQIDKNEEIRRVKQSVDLNILDKEQVKSVIAFVKPDVIFHLAAQSNVMQSWDDPTYTLTTNIIGTVNIVEVVGELSLSTKIITIGSSEEYGITAKYTNKLTESSPCLPQNPYAISKFAAGEIAQQIAKKYHLNHIHVRPFNHFGPGQQEGFVISDFASKIARIEAGLASNSIKVGYLEAERDFTDVRDIIDAYVLLIESVVPNGIYNIGSGVSRSISEVLDYLIELADVPIDIEIDYDKYRISEVKNIVGDSNKVQQAIDWKPEHDFKDSLKDTLNWWRASVTVEI
ncbi:GDP-mannose 4,6-dehydratase [Paraliobacillus sediminis]|uniref:GDP-mannose 4,6-dehydratase n=1 Tax=Paraliobacillus sediminis TaxID=1885916 RepID=UPI000E3E3414|nr:GDP-mannose 4,6-dehydratase [Paraliobacillus sediminis]